LLQVRMGCGASSSAVAPKADRPPIKVAPKQPGINELMSPRQMTPRELLEEKCATKVQSMYRGKADRRFTGQMQTERRIAKMTTDAELKRSSTSATLQSVNNYNFIKTLGKGAYGQVYLATTKDEIDPELVAAQPRGWFGSSTQVQVAVKVLSRSILRRKRVGRHGSAYDSVLGEIAVMKQLQHPNIVRLYEVIDDPDEDLLFMVMEVVGGGDLSAPIEAKRIVPEPELRLWLRGLVLGLEHLHLCAVLSFQHGHSGCVLRYDHRRRTRGPHRDDATRRRRPEDGGELPRALHGREGLRLQGLSLPPRNHAVHVPGR